jgi:hypothetical protein
MGTPFSRVKMSVQENKRQYPRDEWDPALRKSMTILHDARRAWMFERDRMQQNFDQRLGILSTRLWIACGALGFTATVLAGIVVMLFDYR